MDLVMLVLVLSIVGFLLWLITTKIPMDPTVKVVIQVIIVVVLVLYALRWLGVALPNFR